MREHPEIASQPIGRPVFIIGLPRTGTTLLHNALAQHPDLRCPNLWELLNPAGPRDPAQHQQLMQQAEAYVEWYYRSAPRMRVVHPMDAQRPDECQRLLGNAFRTAIYWLRYNVPSYAAWLVEQDFTRAYQYHQTLLRNILWRIPGQTPVLKDPFHIWHFEALARVYPTARYVFLHRDPVVSVASTCSLSEICRSARSDHIDRREIAGFWLPQIHRALTRFSVVRRAAIPDSAGLDVRYDDLTRRPLETLQRICAFIEAPVTEEATRRFRAFLTENPLQKHGVHTYTAEDFGLNRGELIERFAGYRDEYGLH